MTGVVEINVGGVVWTTTWETLAGRDGMLRALHQHRDAFKTFHKNCQAWPFFDRNGQAFGVVMNLLRTGQPLVPHGVEWAEAQAELDFFFPGQRLFALTGPMARAAHGGLWPRFCASSDVLFKRAQIILRQVHEKKEPDEGDVQDEFEVPEIKQSDGAAYFLRTAIYRGAPGPVILHLFCGCGNCWFDHFVRHFTSDACLLEPIAFALGAEYAQFAGSHIELFYFPLEK